jgi:hypothetical protein
MTNIILFVIFSRAREAPGRPLDPPSKGSEQNPALQSKVGVLE